MKFCIRHTGHTGLDYIACGDAQDELPSTSDNEGVPFEFRTMQIARRSSVGALAVSPHFALDNPKVAFLTQ
jgi:hypothetical protein